MHHYSEKMKWWQILMAITFFVSIYVGSFYVAHIIGANSNDGAHNVVQAEDVIESEKEPETFFDLEDAFYGEEDVFNDNATFEKVFADEESNDYPNEICLPFVSFND